MRTFIIVLSLTVLSGCAHLDKGAVVPEKEVVYQGYPAEKPTRVSRAKPKIDNDAEFSGEQQLVEIPYTTMPRVNDTWEFCFDCGKDGMKVYSSAYDNIVVVYCEDDYTEVVFTSSYRRKPYDQIYIISTTDLNESGRFFRIYYDVQS